MTRHNQSNLPSSYVKKIPAELFFTLKTDRNRQLLAILFRRGSKAFPCLIDGLRFLNCNVLVSLLQTN
jgi:hypothetical protein